LKVVLKNINSDDIAGVGISGMMHGYLAFDKDWNLLAPFATWQNTITEQSAEILTKEFEFNVPQRWSVCHLYQRVLNKEPHVKDVAHITTLAGYIHFMLTGENVVGIGEASGMFPIDGEIKTYNANMVKRFNELLREQGINKNILDLLPSVMVAGQNAGKLKNTDIIDNLLPKGIQFAPPEGDVQTGMVATNSVAKGCGNLSAGTSIFLTTVTGRNLKDVYSEVDIVNTPAGEIAVMIHANNCTNDINQWFGVLKETAEIFGGNTEELYPKLFEYSLKGDADCGGVVVYNYMSGEPITHVSYAKPIVVRTPNSKFTLANFVRAQLYGALATVRVGFEILESENVKIKRIMGHGGYYKTPKIGQLYTSAALKAPVYCNSSAGEGGPFGMAVLASYVGVNSTLEEFLDNVFTDAEGTVIEADKETIDGFNKYMIEFKKGLGMQNA
jgi:sugar (pentulose or hexulose) kinase